MYCRSENGPKYKEKDWTNSDLRGVQIYEEEWTGWMKTMEASVSMGKRRMEENIRKRIGEIVINGENVL